MVSYLFSIANNMYLEEHTLVYTIFAICMKDVKFGSSPPLNKHIILKGLGKPTAMAWVKGFTNMLRTIFLSAV